MMKSINFGLSFILGVSLLFSSEHVAQAISISTSSPSPADEAYTYVVQEGDSLWSIAYDYNVTVQELRQENNLRSPFIFRGQEITIPEAYAKMKRHRVESGDTLFSLAREHDMSVTQLKRLNELDSNTLHIGQMLILKEDLSPESSATTVHSNNERSSKDTEDQPASATAKNTTQSPDAVSVASVSEDEMEWLARIIEAEARGEPYEGKVAVGSVVLNRVESDQFPDSIYDVIFQRTGNVHQFTPVANGRIHRLVPTDETYDAAEAALNGEDPTGGALYFYNPDISSDQWIRTRSVIERIGDHVFAY